MKETKYLVMDVDGTLTDGKIYMGSQGEVCKAFHVKDGYGIHNLLIPAGITPVIITGRTSDIVINRSREIGITEIYQGVSDKVKAMKSVVSDLSMVAYIGDDMNDYSCMEAVKNAGGIVGCPQDAVDAVKRISDYVSEYKGGEGAVRDFIEWLLSNVH